MSEVADGHLSQRAGRHDEGKPVRSSIRRRWLPALAIGVVLGTAVALWASLPWTWSWLDDGASKYRMVQAIHSRGLLAGWAAGLSVTANLDHGQGIWRPMYWLYTSLVFLLPARGVYAARLIFMLVAYGGVLLFAWRRMAAARTEVRVRTALLIWGAGLLLANPNAYDQLHLDLQEVPGAAFVSVGLCCRNRWVRAAWWLMAAFTKAPYSWVLVAYGVFMLWAARREPRRAVFPLALIAAGLGNLLVAYLWTRRGFYTATLQPSLANAQHGWHLVTTVLHFPLLVLVLGVPLLAVLRRLPIPRDVDSAAMLLAGLLYLGNLLPYGGGPSRGFYYFTAVAYLLAAGTVLAVVGAPRRLPERAEQPVPEAPARRRLHALTTCLLLLAPVALAGWVTGRGLQEQERRNLTTVQIQAWLRSLPDDHLLIGVNATEVSPQLVDMVNLARTGSWTDRVEFVPPSGLLVPPAYYLVIAGASPTVWRYRADPVRRMSGATAYRVVSAGSTLVRAGSAPHR